MRVAEVRIEPRHGRWPCGAARLAQRADLHAHGAEEARRDDAAQHEDEDAARVRVRVRVRFRLGPNPNPNPNLYTRANSCIGS